MKKITFIGLGHMGKPMAINLIKAGYEVTGSDLDSQAVNAIVEAGGHATDSIAESIKQSDVVITMLQTGEQVRSVCEGDEGIFANLHENALFIDSSSIDINDSRALHKMAEQHGIDMIDAPVSGGVKGAETASLTMMVGGDEKSFQHAQEILKHLGKRVIHAGPAGNGQAAKICNNMLLAISMIGTSEAFALGKKLGLEPKTLFDICSNASSACWSMTNYCPEPNMIEGVPSNNNYQPGFTSAMMLKDLNLSQSAANSANANTPLGKHATELYQQWNEQGQSGLDFSSIIRLFE